ncbi:MAG: DapH/DapD/GlmU-related protein [candidate division KSB1 bacterium]|jgi:acetyltransferase-like isoleucine patch superfamily enzyme|nr:DapH/DapD/GlmU-related protein [candidate division KSB1 bacterium]
MTQETVEIQKEIFSEKTSSLEKYQQLVIGEKSLWTLIKYELVMLFTAAVPGALGLVLRKIFFPKLLGAVGKNVTFGQNVVLRHPHKIRIGDNVVIDDNVVLDAKGQDNNGIEIGDNVFIGRNNILNCKNGNIVLKDNVNLGFNCQIFSASHVELGMNALIAAYCYFIGGTHTFERIDVSPLEQRRESKGIILRENIWLGSNVQVMDGVIIGRDAIIGTSAVVNDDIPEYAIAVGIPAKVIRSRKQGVDV